MSDSVPTPKIRFTPDTYAGELYTGLSGPRVKLLQGLLNKMITEGDPLKVDGAYGPKTKERVTVFQTRMKIQPANGVARPTDFTEAAATVGVPLHRLFYVTDSTHIVHPTLIMPGKSTTVAEHVEFAEVASNEIVDLTVPRKDLPPLMRDRRGTPTASPSARRGFVIHHSDTERDAKGSNPWGFAAFHVADRKFRSIAYHMVVMPRGPLYKTLLPDEKGYHAGSASVPGDENELYYGICFPGDYDVEKLSDTHYQLGVQAILWWTRFHRAYAQNSSWMPTFLRHSDLANKSCPGKNFPFEQMVTDVNLILRGGR